MMIWVKLVRPMKTSWLALTVLLAVLAGGCANRYQITLSNNNVITTSSKPRLNQEGTAYEFKDAQGKPSRIPAIKVKEIEPL